MGHEPGDPQAGLEPAVGSHGRPQPVRGRPAARNDRRGDRAERRDRAGQAAAVFHPAGAGPLGNQRRHRVDPALHREHPGLPGPGRDAVGAQPGLAPQPQAPAVGQHGDHRGHGQPHPGGLFRHRQLRGLRADRHAGREPLCHQPAGVPRGAFSLHPCRRHAVEETAVGVWPVRHDYSVLRGGDRRPARLGHHLGPDDPQRGGVHRGRVAAAEDLQRPGASDPVLDREPGPHSAAGERRPPGHAGRGGGDLRDPGSAPGLGPRGRRADRRRHRPGLRDKDQCGAHRARAGLAAAAAARMDAHRPDRIGGPGDRRGAVLAVRAGRAETDLRRAEARHAALAVAGLRAGRRVVRRGTRGVDGHGLPVAGRHGDRRLVRLPADLLRPAGRGGGAVRADLRLDPRRPLGVRLVHGDRLGRADPGPAQPDDQVADARHGLPRAVPFQRRPGDPGDPLIRRPVLVMLENSQVEPATVKSGASAPRPAAARAHLAAAVLRRHWLAVVLVAAGLVLRVLAQFAYRPALFYIDTTRYLYNDAQGMDPVGYKGPLRVILAITNFNTVAAVQHLLGLAMAVVLYILLLRRGAPRWLAALAMAPLLLDAYQIQIEQTVMPDTWFEALVVAGLAILLWRPTAGWRTALAG